MGMFDTLNVKIKNSIIGIQTKEFDCSLDTFNWLDIVSPTNYQSSGISSSIKDWGIAGKEIWVSFIFLNGVYIDYSVCQNEKEAQEAAQILTQLWSDPEPQMLVMTYCAQIEKLRQDSHARVHSNLRKFFLNYDFVQNNKKFCDDFLAGNLSAMDKLSNSYVLSNDFLDETQKKYNSLKSQMNKQIKDLKAPAISAQDLEEIKKIARNFPLPLSIPYLTIEDSEEEGFLSYGRTGKNAPLDISLKIYQAKEELIKKLYHYSLKKIAHNTDLPQFFLYSHLFNSNSHPVFQKKLKQLENITLDYETYYECAVDYLFMTGANYNTIKSLVSSQPELERAMIQNATFLISDTDFLEQYLRDFSPSLDFLNQLVSAFVRVKHDFGQKEEDIYSDESFETVYSKTLCCLLSHFDSQKSSQITVGEDNLAGLLLQTLYDEQNHYKNESLEVLKQYASNHPIFSVNEAKNRQILQNLSSNTHLNSLFVICERHTLKQNIVQTTVEHKGRIKKI